MFDSVVCSVSIRLGHGHVAMISFGLAVAFVTAQPWAFGLVVARLQA